MDDRKLGLLAVATMSFGLFGCASWWQEPNTVLRKTPSSNGYLPEEPASKWAAMHLPYAAMSANVYERLHTQSVSTHTLDDLSRVPCSEIKWPVSIKNWTRWWNFPDETLRKTLHDSNMHVEVWEKLDIEPEIVIVFEGTVFTSKDHWKANLRWFLRFLPKYQDQYIIASESIAAAFHKIISSTPDKYNYDASSGQLRLANGKPIKLTTTGHSLGGGLAQQFAYAFPQNATPPQGPKINQVFAFNASPVTGWFSTPNPPRDYNATGLEVYRVFEHGEILAYIRIFTSNLASKTEHPKFSIYRFNFAKSPDVIGSHSMASLACGLARAAGEP